MFINYQHPITKARELVYVRTERDLIECCDLYAVRVRLAALTVDQAA